MGNFQPKDERESSVSASGQSPRLRRGGACELALAGCGVSEASGPFVTGKRISENYTQEFK